MIETLDAISYGLAIGLFFVVRRWLWPKDSNTDSQREESNP